MELVNTLSALTSNLPGIVATPLIIAVAIPFVAVSLVVLARLHVARKNARICQRRR